MMTWDALMKGLKKVLKERDELETKLLLTQQCLDLATDRLEATANELEDEKVHAQFLENRCKYLTRLLDREGIEHDK